MKIFILLLFPVMAWGQDGNFAENNLVATGDRQHSFLFHDLKISELDELRFDIYHQDITQQVFRAFASGTQHSFFMRVMDGTDRATFQLICDTQHTESQIELAGTGNTPIHLDTDAYVRLGNQSALNPGQLRFYNAGNAYYIGFKAPHNFTGNSTYTWPGSSVNGVLTNNNGILSWELPVQSAAVQTVTTFNVMAGWPSSVIPGGTQYFGNIPKPITTVAGNNKIYFREDCTITGAEISSMSQQAGSGEPWALYIRVNNTTDYLVCSLSQATQFRAFSNPAMNITLNAGDFIEMKIVNPVWNVIPINTTFGGYITILQ